MTEELSNMITGAFRYPELLFVDGKIIQRERSGADDTHFVDVTEDVAKAIASYYDGLTIYEGLDDDKNLKSAIETVQKQT